MENIFNRLIEEPSMPKLTNTMEIFKLLPRTNCRKCNAPTCLAFAAAVFQGQRRLQECPFVDAAVAEEITLDKPPAVARQEDVAEHMAQLKSRVAELDLARRASELGGRFADDKLILKILGKDFAVDKNGHLTTDLHINPWLATPVFDYLLNAKGVSPTGRWVSLRELKSGRTWFNFFSHRCEKPMKSVADTYPDLFEDMVHLFNGKQVENHYDADISVVLAPLPKVPLLVCYLKPEEGLASNLNIFFDETAEENLNMQSIYTMGAGLANMFEKIALRHGVKAVS
jgi:hypothetical protein